MQDHVQVCFDLSAPLSWREYILFFGRVLLVYPVEYLANDEADRPGDNKEYQFKKYHCATRLRDSLIASRL